MEVTCSLGYVKSVLEPRLVNCANALFGAVDAFASVCLVTPSIELKIECAAHLEILAGQLLSVSERLSEVGFVYSMDARFNRRREISQASDGIESSIGLLVTLAHVLQLAREQFSEFLSSIAATYSVVAALDSRFVRLARVAVEQIDLISFAIREKLTADLEWSRHLHEPLEGPKWLWEGIPVLPPRDSRFGIRDDDLLGPNDAGASTIARSFHRMLLRTEIPTIEICAYNIIDSESMPVQFLYDMARQASDEARHASACILLLVKHGGSLGQFGSTVELWEVTRGRSLALRLAIHQRGGETVGINAAHFFAEQYAKDGDEELLNVQEFIYHDEIAHVAVGNKWLRVLCGDCDEALAILDGEAESARSEVSGVVSNRARQYPVDVPAMRRAGYSNSEVDRWTKQSSQAFPFSLL